MTDSKIFCGCSTRYGAPPNTQICPVCLGLPGALPVLNRRAVDYAVRAALALGCTIHETSIFARKNYFYPDLPKGYQISQYDQPLATGGALEYVSRGNSHRIEIVRVHLEEDAGKSLHDEAGGTSIDFNRSGVPLIEIVTAPDLRTAGEAAEFFSRLRAILVALEVNDGNMEEGSLRCDANVSVRPVGESTLGVKTEVKNVNSFRYLQRALQFEIDRQAEMLSSGGRVVQETRLWDSASGRTIPMRSKEEAHDYRYFPEPDLPPLVVTAAMIDDARALLPELPEARKHRFVAQYALPESVAAQLSQSTDVARYFESAAAAAEEPVATAHWVVGDLQAKLKDLGRGIADSPVAPAQLGELVRLVTSAVITGAVAKEVFERMCDSGRSAADIVAAEGLGRVSDLTAIDAAVQEVLREHPRAVSEYRAGKTRTFAFLVGQVMKKTGGKADPAAVNELVKKALA